MDVNSTTWFGSAAFAEHYGYVLPREAEWEYACRGGDLQFEHGTDDGTLDPDKVNYWETGFNHPVDVASFPPNPFSLYDMNGNVWEWCNDWYEDYTSASQTDPTGPSTGTELVYRGAGWYSSYRNNRSASRWMEYPWYSAIDKGFRVARRP